MTQNYKGKKVFLLICTQTLGLEKKDWTKILPELALVKEVEPIFVFQKLSVDTKPSIWLKLVQEIKKNYDEAAGFVIIHGVDNLLYASAALSFLIQNLNKPVIFTGTPSGVFDTSLLEVKANLINSVGAASFHLPEICLIFGNRILRANQSSRNLDESLNIFIAPEHAVLGRIDFSIRVFEKDSWSNKGKTIFFDSLSEKVTLIHLTPWLDLPNLSRRLIDQEGVIINAEIYENLPQDLLFLLEKTTPNLPVVIWSKKFRDREKLPNNFMVIDNLTWPALVTKLMWILTQTKNIKEIKKLFIQDISHEVLPDKI